MFPAPLSIPIVVETARRTTPHALLRCAHDSGGGCAAPARLLQLSERTAVLGISGLTGHDQIQKDELAEGQMLQLEFISA